MPKKKTMPSVPRVPAIPKMSGPSPKRRPPGPPKPRGGGLGPMPMNKALGPMGDPDLDMMGPDGALGGFAPSPEEKIVEWIEMKVLPKNVLGLFFQLRQKSINGETVAHEWDASECEGQDPPSLASMIVSQALEDVEGSTGVTAYVVHAMRPGETASFSRCFFRLSPEDMTQGFDTEPGHLPEGHMAQAHRHAEVYARMMVGQSESVMRHLREQNKEFFAQASKSIQLQVQVADMFQKIQDRQMMRDIVLGRVARKEKMKEQVIGYAMSFLPDVLNRFGIVPGEQMANLQSAANMEAVLAKLDDSQVNMIIMGLPSKEAKDAFAAMYVMSKKKAAAAAAKAAADAAKKAGAGDDKTLQAAQSVAGVLTQGSNGQTNGHANGYTNGAATNGAAQQQQQQQSSERSIDLTAEEVTQLHQSVSHFIDILCGLDDATLPLVLSRIPEGARAGVKEIREHLRDAKERGVKGRLSADQVGLMKSVVVQLLAVLDDMAFGMVVSKIDDKARPDVIKTRETVRTKLTGAAG